MKRKHPQTQRNVLQPGKAAGFSLLELLVVTGAVAVATAMAVPVFITANNSYQLRTATVELASMLQKSRIVCIQNNTATAIQTSTSAVNGSPAGAVVFLDVNSVGAGGTPTSTSPIVALPTNITQTNASAPTISNATLGFTPQALPAYFNGRGLPCVLAAGVCSNWSGGPVGYVYYIKQVSNGTRWSAVSITPAGQIKTWSYSGSGWSNR